MVTYDLVLAPNPSPMTLTGTNTYVVGTGKVAVIDAGPDIPEHVAAVLESAQRRGKLELLLVTHYHPDHLPAARRLRERTGAPLFAHPSIPGVDRALGDGERVRLDGMEFRTLFTPGHSRDHFCFLLEDGGYLFSGDLVLGSGSVTIGPPDGNLGDYMASLERLLGLCQERPLSRILPGHGPVVDRPQEKLQEYLEHRRTREAQVLEALTAGRARVDEIVALLYAEVDPRLHHAAGRNVIAHLEKLEHEARVVRRGESWYCL